MASSNTETPWYAAYPTPRTQSSVSITRQRLLELFKDGKETGKDFVLIDLRRTDYEGGTIQGSINIPAQSLYPILATLYTLFASAGVSEVIWYCGSSRGRGTRAAAWFADYLEDKGNVIMHSLVLAEGIKGWAMAGDEFTELMIEYNAKAWRQ